MGGIKGWREVKVRNGERVVKSWEGEREREKSGEGRECSREGRVEGLHERSCISIVKRNER